MFPKAEPVVLLDDNDPRCQSYDLQVDEIDDEMGQLTISMGEDESDLEDSSNALTQLEELAAGLEDVYASLESNPHGADSLSLRLAQHAHATFARRARIEVAGYSAESVGGAQTRRDATRLAMESISETLKKAYQNFITFMKRLWDAFQRFMTGVFQFFFSTQKRFEKLKARALAMKQAGAKDTGQPLKLPARLQYAFQIKNKPVDPLALVQDGQFVSKIENFGTAYIKYTSMVLSELSGFVATTSRYRNMVQIPDKLRGLLDAETLITKSFQGNVERAPNETRSHVDIPGNRVITISSPTPPPRINTAVELRRSLTGIQVRVRPYEIEGKPQTEIQHISLDDVVTICDESIRCLKAAAKFNAEVNRLMGERSKILRSVGILFQAGSQDVEMLPSLVSSITSSISRYCSATLSAGSIWVNLMKRTVLQVGDVAFLAVKQYSGADAKTGQNPFFTAQPLQLAHAG